MKKLINDVGLEQYDTVRAAYDKARTLLTQESPDRKELSDLLDVLDKNPKGVEWLRDEEGENYAQVYSGVNAELRKSMLLMRTDSENPDTVQFKGHKIYKNDYEALVEIYSRVVEPSLEAALYKGDIDISWNQRRVTKIGFPMVSISMLPEAIGRLSALEDIS